MWLTQSANLIGKVKNSQNQNPETKDIYYLIGLLKIGTDIMSLFVPIIPVRTLRNLYEILAFGELGEQRERGWL